MTNRNGDTSNFVYNALFKRTENNQVMHSGNTYNRSYVIDYTSPEENNDLMVFSEGNYIQQHVYRAGERLMQLTDTSPGNGAGIERKLYVHEDVLGTTKYFTKATGQVFEELSYDAWGLPTSSNKLLNNDNGTFIAANFTGHPFDALSGLYFAEARFYDPSTRGFISLDPAKDRLNWYVYCADNPATYADPTGLEREGAVNYAEEYATDDPTRRNPNYPSYLTPVGEEHGPTNCANFVSQALVEGGGLQPDYGQWNMVIPSPQYSLNPIPIGKIIARTTNTFFGTEYAYNDQDPNFHVYTTSAWVGAGPQYNYFKDYNNGYISGMAIPIKSVEVVKPLSGRIVIKPGDLLYWDLNNDGVMEHVTMITGITSAGDILYSGNNNRAFNESLFQVLLSERDYRVSLVRLKDSVFNPTEWDSK